MMRCFRNTMKKPKERMNMMDEEKVLGDLDLTDYQKTWDEIYAETAPDAPLEPVKVSRKQARKNRKAKTAATVIKAVLIGFCIGFLPYVLLNQQTNPRLWAIPLTPVAMYLIYSMVTDLKGWLNRDEDL